VHWLRLLPLLTLLLGPTLDAEGAEPRIKKVLPHFLDAEGRHTLAPSLYERDAYQFHLRRHPNERAGLRFEVNWKSGDTSLLTVRVEMRGSLGKEPTSALLQSFGPHRGWRSKWTSLTLQGEEYKKFGELLAWRVTLWDGTRMVAEQRSFLW
jgi:hypothetical protein